MGIYRVVDIPSVRFVELSSPEVRDIALLEASQLMREAPEVFSPSDTASKLLGYFQETGLYEAPVVGEDKVGLATLRDLLKVVHPDRTRLRRIWRFVGTLTPDRRVYEAAELMSRNDARAIPIVEWGDVVGILSQVEVTKALSTTRDLREIPVSKVMKHPVIVIEKQSKISSARRLMLDHGISHLPVLDGERLLGIVTAMNIVYHFVAPVSGTEPGERIGEAIGRLDGPVEGIMDLHPFTVGPQMSCSDVARGFVEEEKSACIIEGVGGELLGILTPREIVSLLLRLREGEERVPISIVGLTDEDGFFEASVAEEKIRRLIERNIRFYPQIEEVTVKLKRRDIGGNRTRYEIKALIHGPLRQFHAEAKGWDLLTALDELCNDLDRSLRKVKEEPRKRPTQRKISRP
ncbi:CBS domain-containing protein [Candidatus Bathyarchaeota archaeon]|nr:CBS domain-containing protein [Candidatus Bathyarchaeota archaeon]